MHYNFKGHKFRILSFQPVKARRIGGGNSGGVSAIGNDDRADDIGPVRADQVGIALQHVSGGIVRRP